MGSQVAPLPPPPVPPPLPPPRFEVVFRDHFAFVWRSLRALGVAPGSIDDATQEVFIVVHRRLREFAGRSSLKSWLFGIARGVAANHRRSVRRRGESDARSELELVAAGPGPYESAARSEAARLVLELLDRLDADKRAVLVLVEIEGMAVPEVAEALGEKLNTVYSRLRAARRAFDAMVAQRLGERDG